MASGSTFLAASASNEGKEVGGLLSPRPPFPAETLYRYKWCHLDAISEPVVSFNTRNVLLLLLLLLLFSEQSPPFHPFFLDLAPFFFVCVCMCVSEVFVAAFFPQFIVVCKLRFDSTPDFAL